MLAEQLGRAPQRFSALMQAKQEADPYIPQGRPPGPPPGPLPAFWLAGSGLAPGPGRPDLGGTGLAGGCAQRHERGREEDRPPRPIDALEVGRAIDPLLRVFASPGLAVPTEPSSAPHTPAPLDPGLLKMLRRVAWGGDAGRAAVHLEFGSGELAGARLTLVSRHGAVSLELDLPPGASAAEWEERLSGRLLRRGVLLESVRVR